MKKVKFSTFDIIPFGIQHRQYLFFDDEYGKEFVVFLIALANKTEKNIYLKTEEPNWQKNTKLQTHFLLKEFLWMC